MKYTPYHSLSNEELIQSMCNTHDSMFGSRDNIQLVTELLLRFDAALDEIERLTVEAEVMEDEIESLKEALR